MSRTPKPNPAEYAKRQTAAKDAAAAWHALKSDLERRYQSAQYAPRGHRDRLERLARAESKAWKRFWVYLEAISPRSWESGVPAHWVVDSLTFADAVTRGELSEVPPPAFGYHEGHNRRFADALKGEG